jgi:putative endonuclease
MPSARTSLGNFGERAAEAFLARRGYRIVARKWRCLRGEIDLVAYDGSELVFVEVRTRRGGLPPAESIDLVKRRRLAALAAHYLEAAGGASEQPWRIDVVAITIGPGGSVSVEHIPYAIEE